MGRVDRLNKYTKLISNTVLFAIGSFSSKVLTFLLMPLVTRVLQPEDYSTADLIVQMANLMLPLATAGILHAIIRFGLDKSVRKSDVFTTGLLIIAGGLSVFLVFAPLLHRLSYFGGNTALIYIYVLTSSMRSLCSQFVRAKEYVRLYAIDGVFATLTVVLFNVLFLLVFQLGIVGYVLATVCSDLLSAFFLFVIARLWKYIRLRRGMLAVSLDMLRYSMPLIPTTISWWLTNVSSRYIIAEILGSAVNGQYTAANKIPTIVTIISGIFIDAWQLSAVTDGTGRDQAAFFTRVFVAFQSIAFLCGSGLILGDRLAMTLLTAKEYSDAWRYVPVLVMSTCFASMDQFLGSVYMVEKRSSMALVTQMLGAVINVGLCIVLLPIPEIGAIGAALACLISYMAVFVMRAVSARRLIGMRFGLPRLAMNVFILGTQSVILILELPLWVLWEILLTALAACVNLRPVLHQVQQLLARRIARRQAE